MRERRRFQDKRSLARRAPVRTASETFLIVTEGETERFYFEELAKRLLLTTVDVQVVDPPVTDPIGLVQRAKELRSKRRAEASRNPIIVAFDNAWVVFDRERPGGERQGQANSAVDHARTANVECAQSDPSFEYWLILHHKFTTRPFFSAQEAEDHLREEHMPVYHKGGGLPVSLFDSVRTAVENANKCRKHRREAAVTNPSTDVDILVRKLDDSAPADRSLLKS